MNKDTSLQYQCINNQKIRLGNYIFKISIVEGQISQLINKEEFKQQDGSSLISPIPGNRLQSQNEETNLRSTFLEITNKLK